MRCDLYMETASNINLYILKNSFHTIILDMGKLNFAVLSYE